MSTTPTTRSTTATRHRTVEVDGLEIFYREAGDSSRPTLLLLHGLPTSSLMFRNLIPALADRFHLVAPDYPGFGHSAFPPREQFEYSFANLTRVVERFADVIGLERFSIYIQDYGAPIGLTIASTQPERVQAIVTQSGNAYMEGFTPFWEPLFAFAADRNAETEAKVRPLLSADANVWQWTHGTRDPEAISPDLWTLDTLGFDRPGNRDMQIELFYDYRLNLDKYPAFQQYFRDHQPPTLITWGKNDEIFGPDGARAYLRDLPDAELHLLDTGHFALEEEGDFIAERIRAFLSKHVG
ncbi:alpha/beta fold hydrolase [Conexibacter woesei]|uniref:Alpha/beta hydrolase fold protein n=1 Tax=Conexibacter woesei (strain DSM 14684 / CCUG 47730 / CIP 108061 / JCM 11494 / NBRC 100937 / ID131577) TaxID=469383 RepID=D3F7C8_CONWI|nr:alpha/beta hydrolase [Conexibacter woesei]ADB48899.1 alpha/beta hydrolase fold protein [Conexibacter woesei DSM 14684]